jgi:molybdopterin converting factor subunit 1
MQIRVLLFAILRDAAGTGEVILDLAEGATVESLVKMLEERYPNLARYLPRVAYAVNRSYASAKTELQVGDEVALIPPVSGG